MPVGMPRDASSGLPPQSTAGPDRTGPTSSVCGISDAMCLVANRNALVNVIVALMRKDLPGNPMAASSGWCARWWMRAVVSAGSRTR